MLLIRKTQEIHPALFV